MQKIIIFLSIGLLILTFAPQAQGDFSLGGRVQNLSIFGFNGPEKSFWMAGPNVDFGLSEQVRFRASFLYGTEGEEDAFHTGGKIIFDFAPGGVNPYLGAGGGGFFIQEEENAFLPELLMGTEIEIGDSWTIYGELIHTFLFVSRTGVGISFSF